MQCPWARPATLSGNRKQKFRRIGFIAISLIAAVGLAIGVLIIRDLHWWQALPAWLALIVVFTANFLLNETIVCLPGGEGIVHECRLVGMQMRWKQTHTPYSSIRIVLIESGFRNQPLGPFDTTFNPNVAVVWTYIRLQKDQGATLFWFTKYDGTATDIARTLASFVKCPVEDRRVVFKESKDGVI